MSHPSKRQETAARIATALNELKMIPEPVDEALEGALQTAELHLHAALDFVLPKAAK